ncbi:hypothetical protein B0I35DRAFT_473635 [Stachybotrys elegans]|uniref:Uncharacterized protein n=1 Tax=Stachybotrys elegans TaxID=80388 RepID=A0A8K0SZI8_9HYPO|nr:hypothetical protein B0I35DRAFT_473635 [Stachybotrys elegans]
MVAATIKPATPKYVETPEEQWKHMFLLLILSLETFLTILARVLPALIVVGSVGAVATFVVNQLSTSSRNLDRSFAAYNNAQSEASRQKTFEGFYDNRNALFNVLGWRK